jgi:hypothetical protein
VLSEKRRTTSPSAEASACCGKTFDRRRDAAADHHDIERNDAILGADRNDVDIARRRAFDELARLQLLQPLNLVANAPRRARTRAPCRSFICVSSLASTSLVLPAGTALRRGRLLGVFGLRDEPDARRGAAMDLMEHAGP